MAKNRNKNSKLKWYKTKGGFEFRVDPDALDDDRFLDLIIETEDGSPTAMVKLYKMVLGEKQYNKAREFVKEPNGRVRTSKLLPLLQECLSSINPEGKN